MDLDEFPRQLARTRRFSLGVPREVTISADGGRVLFLRTGGGEDPVSRLWLLDLAEGGGEQLLADPAASWNAGSGEVPEAERIRRERARELASGIVAYSADDDCRTVAFALDGQLWVLDDNQPSAFPRPVPTAGPRFRCLDSRVFAGFGAGTWVPSLGGYLAGIAIFLPMASGRAMVAWAFASAWMRAPISGGNGAVFRAVMSI